MTRLRRIITIIIGVYCLTAVAAAAASAATKQGEIVKNGGTKLIRTKFRGGSSKTVNLQTAGGGLVECLGVTFSASLKISTDGTITLTFTACFSAVGKCKTAGAANAGEIIVTTPFLVTTSANRQSDLILDSLSETTLECGSVGNIKVRGSLFVKVDAEGILSTKNVFEAKVKGPGEQEPEETTNHLEAEFPKKPWENASLEVEELNVTFEEQVEAI